MRTRATLAALVAVCPLLLACEPAPAPEPDFEWRGEWLDILGFGSAPEQTCAGSFAYLDDFAGATAQEFGVSGQLGVYRWYSPAEFAADDPCMSAAAGCTGSNGVFTRLMPFEHEVVHLVNNRVVACPSVLAEGLAEVYGTTSQTPEVWDVMPLIRQSAQGPIALADYPLAGAFVADLIESYGLPDVLRLCELSGPYPDEDEFAAATEAALGDSLAQVLAAFADFDCSFEEYRSRHFECGGEPDLVVGAEPVELELELDCQSPTTVGPRDQEIWTLAQVRVLEPGTYLAELTTQTGSYDGLRVELAECVGCSASPRVHDVASDGAAVAAPIQLNANDFMVRIFASPEFADLVTVRLTLL